MSSNITLRRVIANYSDMRFTGERASKRPDLLLSQDLADSYLLIEFKRPTIQFLGKTSLKPNNIVMTCQGPSPQAAR